MESADLHPDTESEDSDSSLSFVPSCIKSDSDSDCTDDEDVQFIKVINRSVCDPRTINCHSGSCLNITDSNSCRKTVKCSMTIDGDKTGDINSSNERISLPSIKIEDGQSVIKRTSSNSHEKQSESSLINIHVKDTVSKDLKKTLSCSPIYISSESECDVTDGVNFSACAIEKGNCYSGACLIVMSCDCRRRAVKRALAVDGDTEKLAKINDCNESIALPSENNDKNESLTQKTVQNTLLENSSSDNSTESSTTLQTGSLNEPCIEKEATDGKYCPPKPKKKTLFRRRRRKRKAKPVGWQNAKANFPQAHSQVHLDTSVNHGQNGKELRLSVETGRDIPKASMTSTNAWQSGSLPVIEKRGIGSEDCHPESNKRIQSRRGRKPAGWQNSKKQCKER